MPKDDLKTAYRLVGTRPNRPDGLDKVTGRARYGADISAARDAARRRGAIAPCPCADHPH